MTRAWIVLASVVVLGALVTALLFTGYQLGQSKEREKWEARQKAHQDGQDAALQAAAKAIAKIEVKSAPVKESLIREIRTVPVYRDCQHSPDGVRYLNELITGEAPGERGPLGMSKAVPAD